MYRMDLKKGGLVGYTQDKSDWTLWNPYMPLYSWTSPCSERRWWKNWERISGFKLGWVRVKRVLLVVMLCDHITREMQVLSMQCSVVLARTILSFNISSLLIPWLRNFNISIKALTCNSHAAEKYFDTVNLWAKID